MKKKAYTSSFCAEGIRLTYIDVRRDFRSSEFAEKYELPHPQANIKDEHILHSHEWFELFYIPDGCGKIYFENETIHVKAEEFILLPPSSKHRYIVEGQSYECKNINFFVEVTDPKSTVSFLPLLTDNNWHRFGRDEACRSIFTLIQNAQDNNASEIAVYIFTLLVRAAALTVPEKEDMEGFLSDNSISRIYKIDALITCHYRENIPLAEIAEELHLSSRQLSRIIKSQYGCTYHERITALRMRSATEMLVQGTGISGIAEYLGYNSTRTFRMAFEKYFGVSPKSYQAQMRMEL